MGIRYSFPCSGPFVTTNLALDFRDSIKLITKIITKNITKGKKHSSKKLFIVTKREKNEVGVRVGVTVGIGVGVGGGVTIGVGGGVTVGVDVDVGVRFMAIEVGVSCWIS